MLPETMSCFASHQPEQPFSVSLISPQFLWAAKKNDMEMNTHPPQSLVQSINTTRM
jgi:hypothetical protein